MNVTDYHMTPFPTQTRDVPVNPVIMAIGLFLVVGLIFAFFFLWLSD